MKNVKKFKLTILILKWQQTFKDNKETQTLFIIFKDTN